MRVEKNSREETQGCFFARISISSLLIAAVCSLTKSRGGGDKMEKWKIADHLVIYELERNEREKIWNSHM